MPWALRPDGLVPLALRPAARSSGALGALRRAAYEPFEVVPSLSDGPLGRNPDTLREFS